MDNFSGRVQQERIGRAQVPSVATNMLYIIFEGETGYFGGFDNLHSHVSWALMRATIAIGQSQACPLLAIFVEAHP